MVPATLTSMVPSLRNVAPVSKFSIVLAVPPSASSVPSMVKLDVARWLPSMVVWLSSSSGALPAPLPLASTWMVPPAVT